MYIHEWSMCYSGTLKACALCVPWTLSFSELHKYIYVCVKDVVEYKYDVGKLFQKSKFIINNVLIEKGISTLYKAYNKEEYY
jgi:hypothetical protein